MSVGLPFVTWSGPVLNWPNRQTNYTTVLMWEESVGVGVGLCIKHGRRWTQHPHRVKTLKKRQASRDKRISSMNQRNTLWGWQLPPLAAMTWGLAAWLFSLLLFQMHVCVHTHTHTHSSKHFAISLTTSVPNEVKLQLEILLLFSAHSSTVSEDKTCSYPAN